MTAGLVKHWMESGRLEFPLPGSGCTRQRWQRLALLAEDDIVAARIAEAHGDAVAILHELGGKPPDPGQLWGVWAAESPDAVLRASDAGDGAFTLSGTKVWCSGAGFCTHALVTARLEDERRGLFAVALVDPAAKALPSTWWNAGMARSDTRSVQFTNAHAVAVGDPGDYLNRPGFWHGAIGVAACWLGGARRVAEPLYRCAASESADAYSTSSGRIRLETTRRHELSRAAKVLGVSAPRSLGLPDGRLADHEKTITDSLVDMLGAVGTPPWCAATWRGDGHPDHEAVGRAAAAACERTGATLLEYPIWMWHWATPTDWAVPWDRAHAIPVSNWALARKRDAAQCFRSQFGASPGSPPVLPPFVLPRLTAVGEVVFR